MRCDNSPEPIGIFPAHRRPGQCSLARQLPQPGHLPGAVNIVWRDLGGASQALLATPDKLEQLLSAAGIHRGDQIVAYCRSGPRASLGYLALCQCGYNVRLYDGSYAEWARSGLPVEV